MQISFLSPQFLDLPFLAMLGFIKIDPISEIGPIFMGHGGIQQVSAKRTSCGLTPAYLHQFCEFLDCS